MSDSPLGDPNGPATVDIDLPSIVDTILNLDEVLSGEVRRAEKVVRLCTRPDLEGDIDELEGELASMLDQNGNPIDTDESLSDRTARAVALEIREKQREMAASMRSVRVRALPEDEWAAFRKTHIDGDGDITDEVWNLLIAASAIAPVMSAEQVQGLRKSFGHPAVDLIATAAWNVNTKAGVSIPKSLISSAVLRRTQL